VSFRRDYKLSPETQVIYVSRKPRETDVEVIAVPCKVPTPSIHLHRLRNLRETAILFD
jgi:hypothetical protein